MIVSEKNRVFKAFQRGDSEAAKQVRVWIRRGITRHSRNSPALSCSQDREDLEQDILARLMDARAHDPEKIDNPEAWAYKVASDACLSWLRSTAAERRGLANSVPADDAPDQRKTSRDAEIAAFSGPARANLLQVLRNSLEYIDLAFHVRSTYRSDTSTYQRTVKPYLEAKRVIRQAAGALTQHVAAFGDDEQARVFGPLVAAIHDTVKRLDLEIQQKMLALSYAANDDPDWPLDFNDYIEGAALIKLRPATLIFRVWSKVFKKGERGRYTDYKLMQTYHRQFRTDFRGTRLEYLFKGSFEPKALRIEAFKNSKMKAFYNRLADWIYKKALNERLSLDEALNEENSHVPPSAIVKDGQVISLRPRLTENLK